MALPDNKALLAILNAGDPLVQIVRGHQAVDEALSAAVAEALAEPHAVEIDRMSFGLKLDLAVALGVLHRESSPAYVSLNRIRNAFAHRSTATLDDRAVRDLYASLSPRQRATVDGSEPAPLDVRKVIAALFFEARQAYYGVRDAKIAEEALGELVRETLAGGPNAIGTPSAGKDEVGIELQEKVARMKRERGLLE